MIKKISTVSLLAIVIMISGCERTKLDASGKDPVCGMKVTEISEHHFEYEKTKYFFCGKQCLEKFSESPITYIKTAN